MSKDLSRLVIAVGQHGQVYETDTHRMLAAAISFVGYHIFIATDTDGKTRAFNFDGSGCQATGHGNARFEPK